MMMNKLVRSIAMLALLATGLLTFTAAPSNAAAVKTIYVAAAYSPGVNAYVTEPDTVLVLQGTAAETKTMNARVGDLIQLTGTDPGLYQVSATYRCCDGVPPAYDRRLVVYGRSYFVALTAVDVVVDRTSRRVDRDLFVHAACCVGAWKSGAHHVIAAAGSRAGAKIDAAMPSDRFILHGAKHGTFRVEGVTFGKTEAWGKGGQDWEKTGWDLRMHTRGSDRYVFANRLS